MNVTACVFMSAYKSSKNNVKNIHNGWKYGSNLNFACIIHCPVLKQTVVENENLL